MNKIYGYCKEEKPITEFKTIPPTRYNKHGIDDVCRDYRVIEEHHKTEPNYQY